MNKIIFLTLNCDFNNKFQLKNALSNKQYLYPVYLKHLYKT